ncbi:MAG: SCO family protein [Acidobacteria bacterium]|nr:MAG: SCO family protein [Acidobacteriota bacterium]
MTRSFAGIVVLVVGMAPGLAEEPACHHGHASGHAEAVPQQGLPDIALRQVPDLPVIDQDGRQLSFRSDLVEKGPFVMNFVFTTCTTICPPMGAIFGRLQDELGARLGRDVRLVSVSIDPVTDTPERLKAWSGTFGRREGWTLVTGRKDDVDVILRSLGALTPDKVDHAPLVLVGDPASGRVRRVYGLAAPDTILAALEDIREHVPDRASR